VFNSVPFAITNGLVEAPQIWYCECAGWLVSQGYVQCPVDPALFTHATSTDIRYIVIHVNDSKLLFEDKNEEAKSIRALVNDPASHGGIVDLEYDFGECCGVEYTITPDGYYTFPSRNAGLLMLEPSSASPAETHVMFHYSVACSRAQVRRRRYRWLLTSS
jgi:hypothetical protein